MDYIDYTGPNGQADNMGGLTQRLWYAPKADFLSIKTVIAVPVTVDDLVKITTAHTFKTGKCFKVMYITRDKGKVMGEPQGDTDGKSFKQKLESFYPGSDPSMHGFAAMCKNDQFICLAEQADGSVLQVGTERFPASCTPKYDSSSNSSGARGHHFEWETNETRQYVYTAAITVIPAP